MSEDIPLCAEVRHKNGHHLGILVGSIVVDNVLFGIINDPKKDMYPVCIPMGNIERVPPKTPRSKARDHLRPLFERPVADWQVFLCDALTEYFDDTQRRLETGVVQCGDDWPGVFIRGDMALHWAVTLEALLPHMKGYDFQRAYLEGLVSVLRSCAVTDGSLGKPGKPEALTRIAVVGRAVRAGS